MPFVVRQIPIEVKVREQEALRIGRSREPDPRLMANRAMRAIGTDQEPRFYLRCPAGSLQCRRDPVSLHPEPEQLRTSFDPPSELLEALLQHPLRVGLVHADHFFFNDTVTTERNPGQR